MRWFTPVFTAAFACSLAACAPAEAPPDDTVTPPNADVATSDTAPDAPAMQDAGQNRVVHYDCEGTPVDATFDGHGQVSVAVDGATMVLRSEDTSSDRFHDEAGNELWMRGETTALLKRPDRPDRTCEGMPAAM